MVILKDLDLHEVSPDGKALRVFLKALDLVGGPRKVLQYRNLTWIPSLLEASYAVVLSLDFGKTAEEIAEELGITVQTVRNLLRADPKKVKEKLRDEVQKKEVKVHTAGGMAKWAYEEVNSGRESESLFLSTIEQISEIFGIRWPLQVLKRVSKEDFPIERARLRELLGGISFDGDQEKILDRLPEKVESPIELIRTLGEIMEGR